MNYYMAEVTLKTIHNDLTTLKKEMEEMKNLLYSEPELREEVVREVEAARERMKTSYAKHEAILKEFSTSD